MSRSTKMAAPAETKKRCAIYTRKSTSAGLEMEFNSLDAQREACLAYIGRQDGWTVVDDRYDDGGFTGANTERPAFQRMLEDIDAGKIDIVVVYKVDRLSRSLLDFAKLMDRFNKAKAAFVSVTQNFSTADAMGRLTLNVLMSFAEFERSMIAERTRDKVVAARRKGKWTGGPVPLGYQIVDGKLAVDVAEARVVRQVFGLYEAHRSIVRILDELAAMGTTTKTKRAWTKDGVLRVLKNPIYAGFTRHEAERFQGEHEAIVEPAMFDRVQALMGRPAPALNRRGEGDTILRGLARCGACEAAMIVETARRGRRTYRYLRCDTAQKHGTVRCPGRTRLPLGPVEEIVVGVLREHAKDEAFAATVRGILEGKIDLRRHDLLEEQELLPKSIGEASARVHSFSVAFAEAPGAGKAVLARRVEEEAAIVNAQQARLADVRRELAGLAALDADAAWVGRTLERFDAMWGALTDAQRVVLVQAVVNEVVLDPKREQVRIAMIGARAKQARTPVGEGEGDSPPEVG
jgi:DNA invertase Pin-like site-specific DNA recombinase